LDVSINEKEETAIVSVEGRIDAASAQGLDEALGTAISHGRKKILVNLEKAVYMSSSGLRVLLGKLKGLRKEEGDMALCSLQPDVYRVFMMAGVHEVFPIYLNMEDVLAADKEELERRDSQK